MKKIALITPMLQPYRITFYEKLAFLDPEYEWKIYHGMSRGEDGRPNFKGETRFSNLGFPEFMYFVWPFKIRYNKGMFAAIREYDPDLVIVQAITGNLTNRRIVSWAKRKNKKLILWFSGYDPGLAKGLLKSLKKYLVSTFFRKADLHLTYSTKGNAYAESMGIPPEKIRTSYNGIEIEHLLAKEEDIWEGSKEVVRKYKLENHVTFLYVGGLIPEKRVDLLLEAFCSLRKKYDHIKLLIIGDGPLKEETLKTISEQNDDHIHYLGRIIEGADPFFAASDCFVLPGVGGLALNQAMLWRKTCIVSEADGTEDDLVIENVTGFRFERNNLSSLTDAMERRINKNRDEMDEMEAKARKIIETKSNVNNMVRVFMGGVKDLLSNQ